MYILVYNMSPSYISDLFTFQSSEFYNLRSIDNDDMIIPKHKTELFKKSFQYSGPHIWNTLPISLQTAYSLSSFKHNLHTYIVTNRIWH